jgi:hypothetical protein
MPNCACEQQQQSPYSPSSVKDCEVLIYCLIQTDLYDPVRKKLKNMAFSKTKLRETKLSIVRRKFASEDILKEVVISPQLKNDPKREFCGVIIADCREIRCLSNITTRDVCVVDDGMPNFQAHAHLGYSEAVSQQSKSTQVAVRANLIAIFERNGIITDINSLFYV